MAWNNIGNKIFGDTIPSADFNQLMENIRVISGNGTSEPDSTIQYIYEHRSYDRTVASQSEFNELFERTGAGTYNIKDDIGSILFKTDGLELQVSGIFESGDTSAIISTNNCTVIDSMGTQGIDFDSYEGYINVNTSKCRISNLHLYGDGTTTETTVNGMIYINAVYDCVVSNCIVSGRIGAQNGFQCSANGLRSNFVNCLSIGASTANGFYYCDGLVNCTTYGGHAWGFNHCVGATHINSLTDVIGIINSSKVNGFNVFGFTTTGIALCYDMSNGEINGNSVATGNGIYECADISNCRIYNCTSNYAVYNSSRLTNLYVEGNLGGILTCLDTTNVYVVSNTGGDGFNNCSRISDCLAYNNTGTGFNGCTDLSACKADSNTGYGFSECFSMSSTSAVNNSNYGYYNCTYMAAGCRATGNNSSGAQFHTTYGDVPAAVTCSGGSNSLGEPLFVLELSGTFVSTSTRYNATHNISNLVTNSRCVSLVGAIVSSGFYRYPYGSDQQTPEKVYVDDSQATIERAITGSALAVAITLIFK